MKLIETERLLLREFTEEDSPFILVLLNDPSWLQYIGDRNIKNEEDARNYLINGPMKSYSENGFGLCMVETKVDKNPIGMCGLIRRSTLEYVDIGFALLPQYAGKGYAYEIASATMTYAKNTLKLDHVVAITSTDNTNSIALLNKIGLRFDKMIKLSEDEEELMLFTDF